MDENASWLRMLAAGAVVGVVVLGLIGRLATALVAVSLGFPANVSPAGLVEAIVLGAVHGAIGGALLVALDRFAEPGPLRGVLTGAALFAASLAAGWARGRFPDLTRMEGWVLTAIAALVYVGFGVVLARVLPPGEAEGA